MWKPKMMKSIYFLSFNMISFVPYAYGFLMSYSTHVTPEGDEELANVYLSSPPVPTSGALVAVPADQVLHLDLSGEEAMKLIISGGMAAPERLHGRRR